MLLPFSIIRGSVQAPSCLSGAGWAILPSFVAPFMVLFSYAVAREILQQSAINSEVSVTARDNEGAYGMWFSDKISDFGQGAAQKSICNQGSPSLDLCLTATLAHHNVAVGIWHWFTQRTSKKTRLCHQRPLSLHAVDVAAFGFLKGSHYGSNSGQVGETSQFSLQVLAWN